ncbi:MAG TPA: phospholipase D-like domain-containing protein [Patescibacteria group bacterium]|nr:phospholipase D-like domain-containing protein [Patescibacteria group bacterium]
MGIKRVRVITNVCEALVIWQLDKPIAGCRGFALEREVKGERKTEFLKTWVGFKGQKHAPGESRPSTEWPIQRFSWSDYEDHPGKQLRYRVIPMIGSANDLKKGPENQWSKWTDWTTIATGQTKGFEAYFNQGIVPSQWISRQDPTKQSLEKDISDPNSPNRKFLSGELRLALLRLLADAKKDGVKIYAALFELNDPELTEAVKALGSKCSLLLGNGAYKPADKKKGIAAELDENQTARDYLRKNSDVKIYDRIVKSPHFAHNKFVVFCDKQGNPASVWTGSTNWTMTGLCTQVNNGILIRDAKLAAAYLHRWEDLKDSESGYPPFLAEDGTIPGSDTPGGAEVTAWNTPLLKFADLEDANTHIKAAKQGVLFLMFNPGPKNTLLNTILGLDPNKLFIHGVVNQDPGGKKAPLIKIMHKGQPLPARKLDVIVPAGLQQASNWFDDTFTFSRVMIHSKIVVVDPFGDEPVVMTGSHNFGPKASAKNDDNFVIITKAPGLAAEYAINIMNVYGHYKWMYNQSLMKAPGLKTVKKTNWQYDGNYDNDTWQDGYLVGNGLKETNFWFGKCS